MINKLSIKNFGPIKESNFNVSPLTLFIGPNSSGKSFSALLIHLFLNQFNEDSNIISQNITSLSLMNLIDNNNELYDEFKDSLNDYLNSKPKLNDESFKFPIDKFFLLVFEGFGQCYSKIIESRLKNNWNTDLDKLININSESFNISFNNNEFENTDNKLELKHLSDEVNLTQIKLTDEINSTILLVNFDDEFISVNINYRLWKKLFIENWHNDDGEFTIAHIIYLMYVSKIIEKYTHHSYYVPAAGDDLLKDLNNYLDDEINHLITSSTVQKQLITNLLSSEKKLEKGHFYELACKMEKELINGEIKLTQTEIKDEIVFVDDDYDLELKLELVSSSIRELVPIILYLKYFLKKGDTLILEEPENHIHPKNQLILVKYLVQAINEGLNILLTTHSEYIVEKFNNFIRLGNAKDEIFETLGYDKSNVLDHEKVSIYNFKKVDNYSYIAESIDINETGFDENSFYEVNNELYDESVDIIDAEK